MVTTADGVALERRVARVILQRRVQIQPWPDLTTEGCQEIRRPPLAQCGTRQCHLVVREIDELADHRPHDLRPVRRIDQARTQCSRQLIGVVEAIPAGKLVVGKDLGEVEVGQRRVEDRYVILVLVGDVEVEQTRLERLRISRSNQMLDRSKVIPESTLKIGNVRLIDSGRRKPPPGYDRS